MSVVSAEIHLACIEYNEEENSVSKRKHSPDGKEELDREIRHGENLLAHLNNVAIRTQILKDQKKALELEEGGEIVAQREEPWQAVTAGNKKSKLSNKSPVERVAANNIYEILPVEPMVEVEIMEEEKEEGKKEKKGNTKKGEHVAREATRRAQLTEGNVSNGTKNNNTTKTTKNGRTDEQEIIIKRTPFVFKKVDTKDLVVKMVEKNMVPDIREGNGKITVMYEDNERVEFLKIVDTQKEVEGHTYMTKNIRTLQKVLCGIHYTFNIEEIKQDIIERLNITEVEEQEDFVVDRLETYYSKLKNFRLGKVIVKTNNQILLNKITTLNNICYSRVWWEDLKKPLVTQCHNCFRFGHSMAGGCYYERQCKACPEKGEHECDVKKKAEVDSKGNPQNVYADYTCANCGERGHPPTYSKCSARLRIEAKVTADRIRRADNKAKRIRGEEVLVDAPVPKNNPWVGRGRKEGEENIEEKGSSPKKTPRAPQGPKAPQGDFWDGVEIELGISMETIAEIADAFCIKYKTLTTIEQKRTALAKYYLQINQWQP